MDLREIVNLNVPYLSWKNFPKVKNFREVKQYSYSYNFSNIKKPRAKTRGAILGIKNVFYYNFGNFIL
jgi:hypothetical protein